MTHVSKIFNLLFLSLLLKEFKTGHGALLFSEIAEGLCQNYNQFRDLKSMSPKLEEHHVTPRITPSLFRFSKCDASSCSPFKYGSARVAATASRKGSGSGGGGTANSRPKEEYKRKIIVGLRDQQTCKGEFIECFNNCNGPVKGPVGRRKRRASTFEDPARWESDTVERELRAHAQRTQVGIRSILDKKSRSSGYTVESIWISNILVVSGAELETVKEMLKGREDVEEIRLEHLFGLPVPDSNSTGDAVSEGEDGGGGEGAESRAGKASWWHNLLDVPLAHQSGYDGSDVLVGQIDTGVDGAHFSLSKNYRGEYGWFDPYYKTERPVDSAKHGTHAMGIMVGGFGLGVAPGAKWMACRGCYGTGPKACSESAVLLCAQWILCPTRPNGTDPDCTKKPRVVNNSWGVPQPASQATPTKFYDNYIKCWRDAGIIPVFGAGDMGSDCGTMTYPAANSAVLAIGNVEQTFKGPVGIAVYFKSSRGPPHTIWGKHLKPDFSAPGTSIMSAKAGGSYASLTGTNQAASQVSGTIAIMLDRFPDLTYDAIKTALAESCGPLLARFVQNCGTIPESTLPNFQTGYGVINTMRALYANSLSNFSTRAPPTTTTPIPIIETTTDEYYYVEDEKRRRGG